MTLDLFTATHYRARRVAKCASAGPARDRRRGGVGAVADALEPRTLLSVLPLGPEFLVSGPRVGTAPAPGEMSELARDATGNLTVVWSADDGDGFGVYGQRYTPAAEKVGEKFLVNTQTADQQVLPAVAMDADGDSVVVWRQHGQGAIQAQRYDASGQRRGGAFPVSAGLPTEFDTGADVAMDAAGNFVVVWQGLDTIYAQRFGADGTRLGAAIRVNAVPDDLVVRPHVTMRPDGSFVVAWVKLIIVPTGDYGGVVWAQRFAADGARLGGPVEVATTGGGVTPGNVDVGADADGNFVVAWDVWPQVPEFRPRALYARRFDPSGQPLGGTIVVAEQSDRTAPAPLLGNVAVDPSGSFVVAYYASSTTSGEVYARAYDAAGVPETPVGLRVNGRTGGRQWWPRASTTADGGFLVTWNSDFKESSGPFEVVAQRYAPVSDPGTVAGFAWADLDRDGVRDPGEFGIDGVQVDLFTAAGTHGGRTVTAGGGAYRFDLRGGESYYLWFTAPPAHVMTSTDVGADDAVDSDASSYGRTGDFAAAAGESVAVDAGLVPPGSIAGIIWNDANANGIREAGEAGRAGVTLILNGVGTWFSLTGASGDDGTYRFDGVPAGQYSVRFFNGPAGAESLTARDVGTDDSVDSDFDPLTGSARVAVPPALTASADAGIGPRTAVSGNVFLDTNGDGVPGNNDLFHALIVFDDVNGDGLLSPGEPRVETDHGRYQLHVAPGTRRLAAVTAPGRRAVEGETVRNVDVPLGSLVTGVNWPLVPPRATDVFLRGSGWDAAFKSSLAAAGLGDAAAGFRIPPGAQSAAVPWAGVDEVVVRFSAAVDVAANDVTVRGVRGGAYGVTSVERLEVPGHYYRFALDRGVAGDRLTVTIDGSYAGVLGSAALFRLDGDADGQPGGDHVSRAGVLPGDATRDGAVTGWDYAAVRAAVGSTAGGLRRYSPLRDVDGDGAVGATDVLLVRRRLHSSLPPPAAGAARAPDDAPPRPRPVTRSLFSVSPVLV